ncbi:hypothetical protein ACFV8T_07400 [Streptomyces sp. NPDC059832]|uniref:hypothetical protein n=1 Tax=Streptomyces sp. NPDC059832 TaxID=3346966 RepID=UPI00365178D7
MPIPSHGARRVAQAVIPHLRARGSGRLLQSDAVLAMDRAREEQYRAWESLSRMAPG